LNTVLHAEMRALARTLHGPVQDALSAAAFRIKAALENEQPSRALLEEVQASIRTSLEQLPASEREAMDSAAMLTQLVEFWDGIATILCTVSDDAHDALAHYTTSRSSFN